jgi:hypothetical protein
MSIDRLDSSPSKPYEQNIGLLDIYTSYKNSPYLSLKWSAYFQVYAELFEQYRYKPITFVEVGVLNGGSLFMWRDYFGPQARIIGVDLNPLAKKWEKNGFEIHIGNQSDPSFWNAFFSTVGLVDVVLDDGGHLFEQQIVTAHQCIAGVKDGGLLVIEDTHTSYFPAFGYPTKHSFIEWTKGLVDRINARHFVSTKAAKCLYRDAVYSLSFFESMVVFKIDRQKCFQSELTSNDGVTSDAEDWRYKDTVIESLNKWAAKYSFLRTVPGIRAVKDKVFSLYATYRAMRKVGRYF